MSTCPGLRLTDRDLVKIIKRHALRVGLDPREFVGHSLRRGSLTETVALIANLLRMADQSGHRLQLNSAPYARARA
jgi:hypothetical protein